RGGEGAERRGFEAFARVDAGGRGERRLEPHLQRRRSVPAHGAGRLRGHVLAELQVGAQRRGREPVVAGGTHLRGGPAGGGAQDDLLARAQRPALGRLETAGQRQEVAIDGGRQAPGAVVEGREQALVLVRVLALVGEAAARARVLQRQKLGLHLRE